MSAHEFTTSGNGVHEISGVMTFDTVPDLLAQTARWAESGDDGITIDLKNITRVDSAGLALMMEWLRLARAARRELRFVNLPDQVRDLIRVSGLQEAFLSGAGKEPGGKD